MLMSAEATIALQLCKANLDCAYSVQKQKTDVQLLMVCWAYASAGSLFLTFSRIMSSVVKSASFLKVPLPKSFSYESVRPLTRSYSGAQSSSAMACNVTHT